MNTSDSSLSSSPSEVDSLEFAFEDEASEVEFVYVTADKVEPYRDEPTKSSARKKTVAECSYSKSKEKETECKCGHCVNMSTDREQICCHNHDGNIRRQYKDTLYMCITQHPMFREVILHPLAQELAWSFYVDQYGRDAFISENENDWRRHIAYRQCARWIWNRLGRSVRRILPACVISEIRQSYPSMTNVYTNFQN